MRWLTRGLQLLSVLAIAGCSDSSPTVPATSGEVQSHQSEMDQIADQWDDGGAENTTSAGSAEKQ